MAETARKLGQLLHESGIASWASNVPGGSDVNFTHLNSYLEWIDTHIRCRGCEVGGGEMSCPIKTCAREKEYELCSECPELEECVKFDFNGLRDYSNLLKKRLIRAKGRSKKEVISEIPSTRFPLIHSPAESEES
jgi:hypothetical protein